MNRVSGWYKRRTQAWMFGLGLLVSVSAGLDAVAITTWLWQNDAASAALASQAAKAVEQRKIAGVAIEDVLARPPTSEETQALLRGLTTIEATGVPIGFRCWSEALNSPSTSVSTLLLTCARSALATPAVEWPKRLIGILLSALAISLGAAFWFELLNRLVSLRGAGAKPKDSTTDNDASRSDGA